MNLIPKYFAEVYSKNTNDRINVEEPGTYNFCELRSIWKCNVLTGFVFFFFS